MPLNERCVTIKRNDESSARAYKSQSKLYDFALVLDHGSDVNDEFEQVGKSSAPFLAEIQNSMIIA